MKSIDVAEVPALVGQYLANPDQESVILTSNGKPLAVVLPVHGADVETISLSLDQTFLSIMERSQRRYEKEGAISHEEMQRLFDLEPQAKGNSEAKTR